MAKTTLITDDLDGSAGAQPHKISVDGETWTIDLSDKNLKVLYKALSPFTKAATKQAVAKPRSNARKAGPSYDRSAFKTWLIDNGHTVSRGRPKPELMAAYRSAGGK